MHDFAIFADMDVAYNVKNENVTYCFYYHREDACCVCIVALQDGRASIIVQRENDILEEVRLVLAGIFQRGKRFGSKGAP